MEEISSGDYKEISTQADREGDLTLTNSLSSPR